MTVGRGVCRDLEGSADFGDVHGETRQKEDKEGVRTELYSKEETSCMSSSSWDGERKVLAYSTRAGSRVTVDGRY